MEPDSEGSDPQISSVLSTLECSKHLLGRVVWSWRNDQDLCQLPIILMRSRDKSGFIHFSPLQHTQHCCSQLIELGAGYKGFPGYKEYGGMRFMILSLFPCCQLPASMGWKPAVNAWALRNGGEWVPHGWAAAGFQPIELAAGNGLKALPFPVGPFLGLISLRSSLSGLRGIGGRIIPYAGWFWDLPWIANHHVFQHAKET